MFKIPSYDELKRRERTNQVDQMRKGYQNELFRKRKQLLSSDTDDDVSEKPTPLTVATSVSVAKSSTVETTEQQQTAKIAKQSPVPKIDSDTEKAAETEEDAEEEDEDNDLLLNAFVAKTRKSSRSRLTPIQCSKKTHIEISINGTLTRTTT